MSDDMLSAFHKLMLSETPITESPQEFMDNVSTSLEGLIRLHDQLGNVKGGEVFQNVDWSKVRERYPDLPWNEDAFPKGDDR